MKEGRKAEYLTIILAEIATDNEGPFSPVCQLPSAGFMWNSFPLGSFALKKERERENGRRERKRGRYNVCVCVRERETDR